MTTQFHISYYISQCKCSSNKDENYNHFHRNDQAFEVLSSSLNYVQYMITLSINAIQLSGRVKNNIMNVPQYGITSTFEQYRSLDNTPVV